MSAMKQKTEMDVTKGSASALKKPMEEGIREQKLAEFRQLLAKVLAKEESCITIAEMLRQKPEDVSVFAELLDDKNFEVRLKAADVLAMAASRYLFLPFTRSYLGDPINISCAVPILSKLIEDEIPDVRKAALRALREGAETGTDISIAIPVLVKLVTNDNLPYKPFVEVKYFLLKLFANDKHTDVILEELRKQGSFAIEGIKQDVMKDLPKLLKDLGKVSRGIEAWIALGVISSEEDHETRVAITKAIMEFMNSHEFNVEAQKNSDVFLATVNRLDWALRKMEDHTQRDLK